MRSLKKDQWPLATAFYCSAAFAGEAQAEWSLYGQYETSFQVPFANVSAINFGSSDIPNSEISISVNGGHPIIASVDTGSRGIIISKDLLPENVLVSGPQGYTFLRWHGWVYRFAAKRYCAGCIGPSIPIDIRTRQVSNAEWIQHKPTDSFAGGNHG